MSWNTRSNLVTVIVTTVIAFGNSVHTSSNLADEPNTEAVFKKPVPSDPFDLGVIEEHVRKIADEVIPCTVALQIGAAHGSGVVVSADGFILTAAHVIGKPGLDVTVVFPDGATAKGKTLGLDSEIDAGLVKITHEGVWRHAAIVPREYKPKAGDWCVATGHAHGFQQDRSAPLRLGRVIDIDVDGLLIRTDCTITVGDSGGPLFDMQGRVIGIHSRITEATSVNLHVAAVTYHDAWERLKEGKVVDRHNFLDRLDTNKDGKITRSEIPEGVYRRIFDRMATKFQLDPDKTYAIDELRKTIGLKASSRAAFDPSRLSVDLDRFIRQSDSQNRSLAEDRFVRGSSVRAAFRSTMAAVKQSTVRIECDGPVALGTIVTPDGWVVTKASQLTDRDKIVCRLLDGRSVPARLVKIDSSNDIAILRMSLTGLKAVSWSKINPPCGSWVATAGLSNDPIAVGVVSADQRPIGRTPGVLGVQLYKNVPSPTIERVFTGSGAAQAGLKEHDMITHVMDEKVTDFKALLAAVQKYRVGDIVSVTVHREKEMLDFLVMLAMPQDIFMRPERRLSGSLSKRRDDFPAAIQHDSVLRPTDCGGPVVDLAGNVVGINAARAGRIATYVIPSDVVISLLDDLKSERTPSD